MASPMVELAAIAGRRPRHDGRFEVPRRCTKPEKGHVCRCTVYVWQRRRLSFERKMVRYYGNNSPGRIQASTVCLLHVSLFLPPGDQSRFQVSCGTRRMESMIQHDIDTEMGYGYIHCGNPFQEYRTAPWNHRDQQPTVTDDQKLWRSSPYCYPSSQSSGSRVR